MTGQIFAIRNISSLFLGTSPNWYKLFIIFCLILNPIIVLFISPTLGGWLLVAEFIFTLAMALKCYPLQPGGLLAIEACFIGLCDMEHVKMEIAANLEVILLLMFMVAGIYFVRDLLLFLFTKLLVKIKSHVSLSLLFCFLGALLSAFLDALTVLAVVITICMGMYSYYHNNISSKPNSKVNDDSNIPEPSLQELEQFRAFLRSILMHAAIGTALGGVCTLVGEPQNLIVGNFANWDFIEFFIRVSPVSIPTLFAGFLTCYLVEKFKLFGFGQQIPENVRAILEQRDQEISAQFTPREKIKLILQALCCIWLIIGLAFHLAAVGLIGLSVIIFATSFCGITSEEEIGKAFKESLPFCALLCVFFTVVSVISQQQLFVPLINWVLAQSADAQLPIFYMANGILSSVSDNVFVATIYIQQVFNALESNLIDREHFEYLAVAINTGTNLPSVATPNGQAAFLFLLTSSLAPLIRLPYLKMVWMALPYTIVLTTVGLIGTWFILPTITQWYIFNGILN